MLTAFILRIIERIEQRYGAEIAAAVLAIFRREARIKLEEEDKEGVLERRAKALAYLVDEQRRADGEVPPSA